MHLWPHQADALALSRTCQRARTSRVLVQLPPGTGKTEIAVRRAVEWIKEGPFRRALIAVSTASILRQYYQRLVELTPLPVGVEKAGLLARSTHKIVLASQPTLWARLDRYTQETLFIIDECHHSNYDAPENLKLVKRFDHVMGLTATPWSNGCRQLFTDSGCYFFSLRQAQESGLVAPYQVTTGSAPAGPWGLVFCSTNQECAERSAAHSGSTWIGIHVPYPELLQRLRAWKSGRVPVLYANRMLLEGFDEPRCAAVWIAKECESPIMIVQMAGRALRALPGKAARIYCSSEAMAETVRASLERLNSSSIETE